MTHIRVLIAEDDPSLRSAIADLLNDERDIELVGAAEDAQEAAVIAAETTPDVALLDVRMPRGGGPRASRDIREVSPATNIVAFSVYDDRNTILEMLEAGAVSYVSKGAPIDVVLDTIRAASRGEGALAGKVASEVIAELSERLRHQATESRAHREMLARIERVIRGEGFHPVFQPIFELTSQKVVGLEFLSRFHGEPRRSPDLWFAEAAAVGLGRNLEESCAVAALETMKPVRTEAYVSVNLSPETVLSEGFNRIEHRAQAAGVALVVEITEHAPVEDYRELNRVLGNFKTRGGRVAVDDAGAGYASLRHILRLQPDIIKLDISLTREIDIHGTQRALARALISFAAEIGISVIAEGIETAEEMQALLELGVGYGQGYHLARPQEIDDLGKIVTSQALAP